MINSAAVIPERTRYTAYGVARHEPLGDSNGDGMVNGVDQAALLVNWNQTLGASGSTYTPDLDYNRDGAVDAVDFATLLTNWKPAAEPEGVLSTQGNTVGYAGYLYDNATNMSLARFRWYDAEEGRWVTRDPVHFTDGQNLYQYVQSSPTNYLDARGLLLQPLTVPFEVAPLSPLVRLPGTIFLPLTLCYMTAELSYQCGKKLSPYVVPGPAPVKIRPFSKGKPPADKTCQAAKLRKDSACGAAPKKGPGGRQIPPVPAPQQGVPRGCDYGGVGCKEWCNKLKQNITNRMSCMRARLDVKRCFRNNFGRDTSRYDHDKPIREVREGLDRMNRLRRLHCKG